MLTVCASSTNTDLTTIGAVKSLLGITGPAQDAYISTVVHAASRWVENVIGRGPITAQSYSETLAGQGRRQLLLKRQTLRAVDRVFDATDTGSATQVLSSQFFVEDAEAGILARNEGFAWTPLMMGRQFDIALPLEFTPLGGQELKPWLVDYRAGWVLGGMTTDSPNYSTQSGTTSTGRTLPEDIELAAMFKAQAFHVGGDEAQSESLDDLSVNYKSLGTDKDGMLITRARELLAPYQSFV
jgi:hypothetical protein